MLTIKGTITTEAQKTELLAGRPAQRDREFTSADVGLVARALALGASIDTAGNVSLPQHGYSNPDSVNNLLWPYVPADAANAISMWEVAVAAKRGELAAEAATKAAEHAQDVAELAARFEEWLGLPEPTPENPGPSTPYMSHLYEDVPAELRDRVDARAAKFVAATREIERRRIADKEENEAAARYRAKARLELLAQLCRDCGDESARERLAQRLLPDGNPLGLLPEAEAVDFVTDHLLPLDPGAGLAPYVKITTKEVGKFCVVDYDYGEPHTDFVFLAKAADDPDVGGLSSEEWATVKRISGAIDQWRVDRPFPGVVWVVEPRVHRGQCRERECPEWPVRRVGVLVRVTIDNVLTVEREYGASE